MRRAICGTRAAAGSPRIAYQPLYQIERGFFQGFSRIDLRPAQRFNRLVVDHARAGRIYDSLASPLTGTGIPVTDFGLLSLAAWFDGKAGEPAMAAAHVAVATENFMALEYHSVDVDWWDDIVTGLPKPLVKDGFIEVPDKPGLGLELNEEAIHAHPYIEHAFPTLWDKDWLAKLTQNS